MTHKYLTEEIKDKMFNRLSEDDYNKFLKNWDDSWNAIYIEDCHAPSSVLDFAFIWEHTEEGHKYWERIQKELLAVDGGCVDVWDRDNVCILNLQYVIVDEDNKMVKVGSSRGNAIYQSLSKAEKRLDTENGQSKGWRILKLRGFEL